MTPFDVVINLDFNHTSMVRYGLLCQNDVIYNLCFSIETWKLSSLFGYLFGCLKEARLRVYSI